MFIKNIEELATNSLRREALKIIETGIDAILPPNIMRTNVAYDASQRMLGIKGGTYNLTKGRLFVIGGGKASGLMAETLAGIIPAVHITAGVVNAKNAHYKTEKETWYKQKASRRKKPAFSMATG